jgi:hypothetical protein
LQELIGTFTGIEDRALARFANSGFFNKEIRQHGSPPRKKFDTKPVRKDLGILRAFQAG